MKKNFLLLITSFLIFSSEVLGEDELVCRKEIEKIEKKLNIPENLLLSIALTESGKKIKGNFVPWPWTINTEGKGIFFKNKKELIKKAKKNLKKNKKNFDLGCMQINYFYHGKKFINLEEMIEPKNNVLYSGQFLIQLKNKHKNWKEAISRYHSSTIWRKNKYFTKVMNNWAYLKKVNYGSSLKIVRTEQNKIFDKKPEKLVLNEKDEILPDKQLKETLVVDKKNLAIVNNNKKKRDNLKFTLNENQNYRLDEVEYQETIKELSKYIPVNVKKILVINDFKYIDRETILDNLERIRNIKNN